MTIKKRNKSQATFFNIRKYLKIPVFDISRVDSTSLQNYLSKAPVRGHFFFLILILVKYNL